MERRVVTFVGHMNIWPINVRREEGADGGITIQEIYPERKLQHVRRQYSVKSLKEGKKSGTEKEV